MERNYDSNCYITRTYLKKVENGDTSSYDMKPIYGFMDKYVSEEDNAHYNEVSPLIIDALEHKEEREKLYDYLYEEVFLYLNKQLENKNYYEAYKRYKVSLISLEDELVRPYLLTKIARTVKK